MTPEQEAKLDALTEKVNDLHKFVFDRVADVRDTSVKMAAYNAIPAYDLPQLSVEQVKVDGVTVNRDGSLWAIDGSVAHPGQPAVDRPVCLVYGYISPVKTPEVWEAVRVLLGDAKYVEWAADWAANPYRRVRSDIPSLLKSGTINALSLGYLLDPMPAFIQ